MVVSYRHPETKEKIEGFPADLNLLEKVEVEYEVFKGWLEPIGHCRSFSELPLACRKYVEYIEQSTGVTIKYIGVGPRRLQLITR